MIRMEHVSFAYRDQGPSVQDVSFHVGKGEFAAILGANGAGKTTTVRLIDGLIKPTAGRVLIGGADTAESSVSERARRVGFLFQNPDRQICKNTVREEILFGLQTVRADGFLLHRRGRTLRPQPRAATARRPGVHPCGGTGDPDPR